MKNIYNAQVLSGPLGTLSAAAPFFNSVLKKLPHFVEKANTFDNTKDTTLTIIGQSTTIAKDLLTLESSLWTPGKQDTFSNYMGQTISGWANVSSLALGEMFNGTDPAIDLLWSTISNGKLIKEAKFDEEPPKSGNAENELRANVVLIIDSGYGCDEDKPLGDYLDDDTMDATGVCVGDKRYYYLAYPDGDAVECKCHYYGGGPCVRICIDNKFSVPPGLDSLDGRDFGGVTKEDLVKGSVRTWIQNSKENGGGFADPTNAGTIDNLFDVDVTTPGFMRIPVCSPERAFQSWDTADRGSSAFYPCDIPPGKDTCGDSTFEATGSSPRVTDCLAIIKNMESDAGTDWTTQVIGKKQREIAKVGSCHFGVEATKVDGNANFVVGGQDVIDIINDAIKKLAKDGTVGAKGDMNCNGNIKSQPVMWGLY